MTIAGRGEIVNTYLADGTLIKRAYYNAADSLVRQTDYGGMFLYENGSLDKIFHDEGYVSIENGKMRIENFTYNYVLTDHLGHTRSVVSSSGEVLQEHAYYPYGMAIGHLSKQIGSGTNYNYLYTQKEVLDYGGLSFTDHHARLWDYETGRWNGIDPALQMHSPYAGMGMNPMAFVDVDGQEAITLAALGVAALKGAIIASIASAVKYSSEAVAFETWDWGDFGKTVGVSAAMGAVSGGLAYGIGEVGSALASGGMGEVGVGIISTGLHMGTQGGLSVAMGGDFWSAALAAGVGHLGGMAMSKTGLGKFGQAAGASVLSGTTSVISGGSFFEGAAVGLIVHMCNRGMHEKPDGSNEERDPKEKIGVDEGVKKTLDFLKEIRGGEHTGDQVSDHYKSCAGQTGNYGRCSASYEYRKASVRVSVQHSKNSQLKAGAVGAKPIKGLSGKTISYYLYAKGTVVANEVGSYNPTLIRIDIQGVNAYKVYVEFINYIQSSP